MNDQNKTEDKSYNTTGRDTSENIYKTRETHKILRQDQRIQTKQNILK